MRRPICAVYAIRNKINGKSYIGSSNNFYYRRSAHLNNLRKGKHHSHILQRAFNKYGEDSFEFIILEEVADANQLIIREQKYFDLFNPPYNVCLKADRPPSQKGKNFPKLTGLI